MWLEWPEIPAVKNQQMIFFDGDLLHRFSYRTLDGMQQVCERFDEIRMALK
jgi:vitamin B12 transport system substrate-binding protein